MIVSKVIGGLGNQMFQYAVGRAVSVRLETDFKIDVSEFKGYSLHQGFELNKVFGVSVALADNKDLKELLSWQTPALVQRFIRLLPAGMIHKRVVHEPYYHYWQGIQDITGQCYISGYWQSERYFSDIEAMIRQDFSFKGSMDEANTKIAEYIQSVNAVSLHVRRGDYVASSKTNAMHGTCALDYYKKAIEHITAQVKDACFFVFSDDIEWVKKNLSIPHECQFINFNQGENSCRDMQLMSLCKHHIIANSTFSWWGAWLNPNQSKIIIAPKKWFSKKTSTVDLIPNSWIRL